MLFPLISTDPTPEHAAETPKLPIGLETQVQKPLNVWLPMKNPTQMLSLLAYVHGEQEHIDEALGSLHYVHFARFLPSPDFSVLWVITTYDGGLPAYIMDFVGVLGDVFTGILTYIEGAPPLPVQRYPREFTDFIVGHNLSQIGVWSAYPEVTVIDILRGARRL
jgi:hypothetical protein